MKDGVIANFEVTEKMLQHFIRRPTTARPGSPARGGAFSEITAGRARAGGRFGISAPMAA